MAIISFDPEALVDYVPEYGNNRDSEDPCVVSLRYVSYGRVQEYSRLIAAKASGVHAQSRLAEISHDVQKKQFVENVAGISGYFVGNREVIDPAEFYETASAELVMEIIRAMESSARLSEGQRKN